MVEPATTVRNPNIKLAPTRNRGIMTDTENMGGKFVHGIGMSLLAQRNLIYGIVLLVAGPAQP